LGCYSERRMGTLERRQCPLLIASTGTLFVSAGLRNERFPGIEQRPQGLYP